MATRTHDITIRRRRGLWVGQNAHANGRGTTLADLAADLILDQSTRTAHGGFAPGGDTVLQAGGSRIARHQARVILDVLPISADAELVITRPVGSSGISLHQLSYGRRMRDLTVPLALDTIAALVPALADTGYSLSKATAVVRDELNGTGDAFQRQAELSWPPLAWLGAPGLQLRR